MLQLSPQMKLLIAVKSIDFRKGIDAIVSLCQQQLLSDPFSGVVFAFCNHRKTAVKLLIYDGTGFWLCLKRFSQGRLQWWPKSLDALQPLSTLQLQILLSQGDPSTLAVTPNWRKINQHGLSRNAQC